MAAERAKKIAELVKALKDLKCDVKVDLTEQEAEVIDEPVETTKGVVGEKPAEEAKESNDSMVMEIADTGKGFQFYADTEKLDKSKFKRLAR